MTGGADCVAAMRTYLEKQTSRPGLAERLHQGAVIPVLGFAPGEDAMSFPATSGGCIAKIELGGTDWFVALAYLAGGGVSNVLSMRKGRKLAKEWMPMLAGSTA